MKSLYTRSLVSGASVCLLLSTGIGVFAQTTPATNADERLTKLETAASGAQMAGDNAWMLTCAALVLMMTEPGLALFYGGLVRKKSVLATMMQSFTLMAVVTVLWAIYGYSIAFSEGTSFFGNLNYLFLRGVGALPNADYAATIPQQTFMIYQLMFAIITPALITGAFAERMKFSAMLVFMVLWSTTSISRLPTWFGAREVSSMPCSVAGYPLSTLQEEPLSTFLQGSPHLSVRSISGKGWDLPGSDDAAQPRAQCNRRLHVVGWLVWV
jgi:hypothetical protein